MCYREKAKQLTTYGDTFQHCYSHTETDMTSEVTCFLNLCTCTLCSDVESTSVIRLAGVVSWRERFENIGITHVFSYINICRFPMKVLEHKVDWTSAQTSPEVPGKC